MWNSESLETEHPLPATRQLPAGGRSHATYPDYNDLIGTGHARPHSWCV
jgi:hypothetical protein